MLVVVVGLVPFAGACAAERADAVDVATDADALTRAQCRGPRAGDPACKVTGVVERQVVGEFDPFVVGDACVTFVRAGSRRYGLVQEPESCPDPDRFENASVRIAFSKGDLEDLPRAKTQVFRDYDATATYLALTAPFAEEVDAVAAFDALDDAAKLDTLYQPSAGSDWATLRPEFQTSPVRIVDTFQGEILRAALDAYRTFAADAFANGGGSPDVLAIQRDGVTYAYAMEASGSFHGGSWGARKVFDRTFDTLGEFSWSE